MWRAIEKYGVIFIRFYLGGFNLVSGLNYFLLFWPQPRIAESTGNDYVLLSMELGLFQFAKVCEIIGGATLVFNRFVPLGLIILMPVTLNIFLINAFYSPHAHIVVSTTRNFVMHGILLVAYANYFYPMLKFRSAPQPAWRDVSRVWKSF
ncbi:MAG: DoxX family protein [Sphingomonas bacterium]|jgi:putative oxidoreductase|nr:DoxX family protein [Sphingomonas bacterium]MDB5718336.1 DoxX family protein [Sphingomonas bacterium]